MNLVVAVECVSCCCVLRSNCRTSQPQLQSRIARLRGPQTSSALNLSNSRRGAGGWVACLGTTQAEPENSNQKEDDDSLIQTNGSPDPTSLLAKNGDESNDTNLLHGETPLETKDGYPVQDSAQEDSDDAVVASTKDEPELLDQEKPVENKDEDLVAQDTISEKSDNLDVPSGSSTPEMKQQLDEPIRIAKATLDILKDQVFAFDTFFVTSQEPYEGGVLFKGNLRGKASKSYEKIMKRMQDRFGDQYKLFLLVNPEDDKPVAVVLPKQTLEPQSTAVPEWFAAGAFGLVSIFTLLLRNVPALQSNLISTFDNLGLLKDGLPGALVTVLILGFHEIGHILVARDIGVKLGVPYFVPSWQIGSFGAITRISSIVTNREDLLKLSAAGPLAGFSLGFVLLLLGFFLPPTDGIGIIVDPEFFHSSLLVGGTAKLLFGDALREGAPLSVNPLVVWAWTGLFINAINSIPAGELDGGRISFALWGRKASARWTSLAIGLLGISSLYNDVAFFWAALIFFLQRGPIAPLAEEITEPENNYVGVGVAILLLGLLVYLPYPFSFNPQVLQGLDLSSFSSL